METAKYKKVSLIFLVAGHTKNPCDRTFNLLKMQYHKKNIFAVNDLISILGSHPMCVAEKAPPFLKYDEYFDLLYKRPTGIKVNHCFEVEYDNDNDEMATTLKIRRSNLEDCQTTLLNVKKDMPQTDVETINRQDMLQKQPNVIEMPGLRLIKRIELSEKYAPLVPASYRGLDIYQRPPPDVLRAFKDKRNKEAQTKRTARQRQPKRPLSVP